MATSSWRPQLPPPAFSWPPPVPPLPAASWLLPPLPASSWLPPALQLKCCLASGLHRWWRCRWWAGLLPVQPPESRWCPQHPVWQRFHCLLSHCPQMATGWAPRVGLGWEGLGAARARALHKAAQGRPVWAAVQGLLQANHAQHKCIKRGASSTGQSAMRLAWALVLLPVDHGGGVGAVQVLAAAGRAECGKSFRPACAAAGGRQGRPRWSRWWAAMRQRTAHQPAKACAHILLTAASPSVPLAAARAAALPHL